MLKIVALIALAVPLAYVVKEYFGDTFKSCIEKGLTKLGS